MPIRDVLVHIEDSDIAQERIKAAVALAKRSEATVTGVALALESTIKTYVGIDIPANLSAAEKELVEGSARAARAKLESIAGEAGVPCVCETVSCSAVDAPDRLAFHARHSDISFLGQPRDDQPGASFQHALLDRVLFDSGRPVYIVPYIGRQLQETRKAVIAWDGGPKAARAVNDAIPLLQGRGEAVVLIINPDARHGRHGQEPGADIAAHLKRHGVEASVSVQTSSELKPDTILLNFLAEAGADLVVMGAYGHSRLREKTFGGVTETLLHQMTAPVLMSV